MIGVSHEPFRCACAQMAYRNNTDGTRDYKVVGKTSCKVCRGSGWVAVCSKCENAGIVCGEICSTCCGRGRVRKEGPIS
jgi:RecJ-like exonuclease